LLQTAKRNRELSDQKGVEQVSQKKSAQRQKTEEDLKNLNRPQRGELNNDPNDQQRGWKKGGRKRVSF
jgi:hypothetical protein